MPTNFRLTRVVNIPLTATDPPDGYVVTWSASDGYFVAKPPSLLVSSSPSSSPYSITTEDVVLVQTHVGAFNITVPTSPPLGKSIYIKDFAGVSAANNIIISSAALIDGSATYTINTNYGSVKLFYDGTTWSILAKN